MLGVAACGKKPGSLAKDGSVGSGQRIGGIINDPGAPLPLRIADPSAAR